LGIESGALRNAVGPYLEDEMKRLNRYFLVHDLTHGGNKKSERIKWALQGRLEKGRLVVPKDDGSGWIRKLMEQASDFPSPIAHDDMIDALAYIDQLADVAYYDVGVLETFEPLDLVSGY
jgi:phage terminase large subunit-like protein